MVVLLETNQVKGLVIELLFFILYKEAPIWTDRSTRLVADSGLLPSSELILVYRINGMPYLLHLMDFEITHTFVI